MQRHHVLALETLFTQISISLRRPGFRSACGSPIPISIWLNCNIYVVVVFCLFFMRPAFCMHFNCANWRTTLVCSHYSWPPWSWHLSSKDCMSAVWLAVKRNETLRCCHLPIFQWNVPWKLLQTLLSNWSNLLGMMGKKQVGDVLRVWNDVFKFGPFCRGASHRRRAAIQTGLLHTLERWTSALIHCMQKLKYTQTCAP